MYTLLHLIIGIEEPTTQQEDQLLFSLYCLLIFALLFYFWKLAQDKVNAKRKSKNGLLYLSFNFLVYAVIGITGLFMQKSGQESEIYLVLSGLISMCLLLSLPFYSQGVSKMDHLVEHPSWINAIKIFGFVWVVVAVIGREYVVVQYADILLAFLATSLVAYFIIRYFYRRGLNFIVLVTSVYFVGIILMNVVYPDSLIDDKFKQMTTYMLGPGLALGVIALIYTFSWFNELSFQELSNIWIDNEKPGKEQDIAYAKITATSNRDSWMAKLTDDDVEKVIEEMIIWKKHRNENLEVVLNLASRNTRNNNNRLKDLIPYDEYQRNRNMVSHALISLIEE